MKGGIVEPELVAVLLGLSVASAAFAAFVKKSLPKVREKVDLLAASVMFAASALFVKFTSLF
jgi:ABC-type amino acid transport system permease subunit